MVRPIQPRPPNAGTLVSPVTVEEVTLAGVDCNPSRFARLSKLSLVKDRFSEMSGSVLFVHLEQLYLFLSPVDKVEDLGDVIES